MVIAPILAFVSLGISFGCAIAPKQSSPRMNSIGMKFVYISPSTFMMGSLEKEKGRRQEETPHLVHLTKGFYIASTEVTQGQWKAVMGIENNPSENRGNNLPVDNVSSDDAIDFCKKLSESEGEKFRLPTEAEWEYACRAGSDRAYGGTGNLEDMGWYKSNSGGKTHPVGKKNPNDWGLFDMHGNVWELCMDWDGDYPISKVVAIDPRGSPMGSNRIMRGGSWDSAPAYCRSALRVRCESNHPFNGIGFRVVLDN